MEVYRITLAQFAGALVAPGSQGRWNSYGRKVIYTAASRSLACLENLVHRDGEGLKELFKVMVIVLPQEVSIGQLPAHELPAGWQQYVHQSYTRRIGDEWLLNQESCVLKVPSAIIPGEYNYLVNPAHPHFKQVYIAAAEDFMFDNRLIAGRQQRPPQN